jgi:hypothetical protein
MVSTALGFKDALDLLAPCFASSMQSADLIRRRLSRPGSQICITQVWLRSHAIDADRATRHYNRDPGGPVRIMA